MYYWCKVRLLDKEVDQKRSLPSKSSLRGHDWNVLLEQHQAAFILKAQTVTSPKPGSPKSSKSRVVLFCLNCEFKNFDAPFLNVMKALAVRRKFTAQLLSAARAPRAFISCCVFVGEGHGGAAAAEGSPGSAPPSTDHHRGPVTALGASPSLQAPVRVVLSGEVSAHEPRVVCRSQQVVKG